MEHLLTLYVKEEGWAYKTLSQCLPISKETYPFRKCATDVTFEDEDNTNKKINNVAWTLKSKAGKYFFINNHRLL